jgi:hypothetical protein
MSTELAHHESGIDLISFYGGKWRGRCLQITGYNCDYPSTPQWITLTREEAIWLCYQIVTKFLGDESLDEEDK